MTNEQPRVYQIFLMGWSPQKIESILLRVGETELWVAGQQVFLHMLEFIQIFSLLGCDGRGKFYELPSRWDRF